MKPEDHLEIERLGGVGGFGLPGSRIRSRVLLNVSDLSAVELNSVTALIAAPVTAVRPLQAGADFFRYWLTLYTSEGRREIEVQESELPGSLQARLQDELDN